MANHVQTKLKRILLFSHPGQDKTRRVPTEENNTQSPFFGRRETPATLGSFRNERRADLQISQLTA